MIQLQMHPKKIKMIIHEALITKQVENNVNRVKLMFCVHAGRINSRSTITYMKSEIFVLTTASGSVICYAHFFTSLPLFDYILFCTKSIYAYLFTLYTLFYSYFYSAYIYIKHKFYPTCMNVYPYYNIMSSCVIIL